MSAATGRRLIHSPAVWAAVLGALVLVAFGPALGGQFVAFDDDTELVGRPEYNPPAFSNFERFWTAPYPDLYTPVLWTVWGLLAFVARTEDAEGVSWDPLPYHAFNLAAHIGAAVMAFLVLRRLVRSDRGAFFGAGLFALHPLQVEAVAWVSGMKTPLSGLFALWSAWHYLRYSDLRHHAAATGGGGSGASRLGPVHYAAATALFLLAMITKPTVVVLPLMIATCEWLLRGRRARELVLPLVPWLVVGVLLGLVNEGAQGTAAVAAAGVAHPPVVMRPLIALHSLSFYLFKLVLPWPLLPDYSHTPESLLARPVRLWLGALPALAVLAAAALAWRRRAWVPAGVALFVLGGATTLGFIPYYYQVYSTVADRYAYLSVLGVALVVAHLLREQPVAPRPKPPKRGTVATRGGALPVVVGSAILLICGVLTASQCARWSDSNTLFTYTLRHNPDSLVAYRCLAAVASEEGRWADISALAQEGLKRRPGELSMLEWAGRAALNQGRLDEAITFFREAVRRNPTGAHELNALGLALAQAGHPAEAEEVLKAATRGDPTAKGRTVGAGGGREAGVAAAYQNLGLLTGRQGRWEESERYFREALRVQPDLPQALALLPEVTARRDAARAAAPQTSPSIGPR